MEINLGLEIRSCNDSFQDGNHREEISYILKRVSEKIEFGSNEGPCYDTNGNKVGNWHLLEEA